LEIPRGKGVSKAKLLEVKYDAKLEFLGEGGGGGAKQKPSMGWSMDIFWYYTLAEATNLLLGLIVHTKG